MIAFYLRYLFILVVFGGVYYAAGFLTHKLISPANNIQKPSALLGISLGVIFWIYAIFLLAALHVLYAFTLYLTVGIVIIWFLKLRRKSPFEFAWPTIKLEPDKVFFVLCVAGVLLVIWDNTLSPRLTADARNYHLLFSQIMIKNHGFTWIPFKPITNWPLNVEMLFTIALIVKDYVLAKLMHFSFGVLLLVAIFQFTKENRGTFAGMLAVIFFLMNDVILRVMPSSYSDLGVTFFFFMAFWYMTKALREPDLEKYYLLLSGIFAGAMAGCKMNGFIGGIILGILFLGVKMKDGELIKSFGRMMLYFGCPAVLLLSPWLIKSAVMTGNPVYPFLFNIFGGPEWNAQLSADLTRAHINMMGMGREPIDYLLLPFRVIWYGQWDFAHFWGIIRRIWIVLVPLAIIVGIRRRIIRWALFVSLLYFISWALGSQQMRYLIPVLALLSFSAAASLAAAVSWIGNKKAARAVSAVILVAASCYLLFAVNSHAMNPKLTLWPKPPMIDKTIPKHIEFINKKLPEDAKILFLNDNNGLYLERDFICPNLLSVPQITRMLLMGRPDGKVCRNLKRKGITHICFRNDGREKTRGVTKTARSLLKNKKLTKRIYKKHGVEIYELL